LTDDKPTYRFALIDRMEEQLADHERRLAVLEREVSLLVEISRDVKELLKGMRDAIDGGGSLSARVPPRR
jgi:hypothetical protein